MRSKALLCSLLLLLAAFKCAAVEYWILASNLEDSETGDERCTVQNTTSFAALSNVSNGGSACNLRAAVAKAATTSGVPILLSAGMHNISRGEITISAETTIYGHGEAITLVNGTHNRQTRLFAVNEGVSFFVRSLTISDFSSTAGGAAIGTYGIINVRRVAFVRCVTSGTSGTMREKAGAIAVLNQDSRTADPSVYLYNATFRDCSATGQGGCLGLYSVQTAIIKDSLFDGCTSSQRGGAIALQVKDTNAEVTISGSSFKNTRGTRGGAISFTVNENSGVYFTVTVADSTFEGSVAESNFGGAMAFEGGAKENRDSALTITSTSVKNARAKTKGGAVFVSGRTTVDISSTSFANCSSQDDQGNGLYVGTEYDTKLDSSFTVDLTDVTFTDMDVTYSTDLQGNVVQGDSSSTNNAIYINSTFFESSDYRYELTCSYSPCDGGTVKNRTVSAICSEVGTSGACQCTPAVVCSDCGAGLFSVGGDQTKCSSCVPGKYASSVGASECDDCDAGKYTALNASIECADCTYGKYQETAGSTSCDDCETGKYLDSEGADSSCSCVSCPSGFAANSTGSRHCTECAAGKAAFGGNTYCNLCTEGKFSNASGSKECGDCAEGAVSEDGATECTECVAGKYEATSSTCSDCVAGTYNSAVGATSCHDCDAGRTSVSPFTSCAECTEGKYSSASASSSCSSCSSSTYSTAGSTSCLSCALGERLVQDSATSLNVGCASCARGKYNTAKGATSCTACGPGTYTGANGSSTCSECVSGTYASGDGAVECVACAAGKFAAQAGEIECTACEAGYYQDKAGSTSCAACSGLRLPGTFSTSPFTRCTICQSGYYQVGETGNGTALCEACSSSAKVKCFSTGVTVNNIEMEEGYYRLSVTSGVDDIRECNRPESCSGSRRLDVAVAQKGWQNVSGQCAGGYTGPLCAVCKRGYYLTSDDSCDECKPGGYSLSLPPTKLAIVIILGVSAFLGLIATYIKKAELRQWCKANRGRLEIGFTHSTILLITYQIIIEFSSVHSSTGGTSLPHPFNDVINFLDFLTMDIIKIAPLDCITNKADVYTEVLVLTVAPLTVFFFVLIWMFRYHRRGLDQGWLSEFCRMKPPPVDESGHIDFEKLKEAENERLEQSKGERTTLKIFYKKLSFRKSDDTIDHEEGHKFSVELAVPTLSTVEDVICYLIRYITENKEDIFDNQEEVRLFDERKIKPEDFDMRYKGAHPLNRFYVSFDRSQQACRVLLPVRSMDPSKKWITTFKVTEKGGGVGGVRFMMYIFYLILPTISTAIISCFRCEDFYYDHGQEKKSFLVIDYSVNCDSDMYKTMEVYAALMILIYPIGR